MSTPPADPEAISLPLRMYFTALDSPHWSKEGDDAEQRRQVQRMRRSHQFAEMVEKLKRLMHAANEARSLDASGMSLEGIQHLEFCALAAHTAVRLFSQDVKNAAARYRMAELEAHTVTPEGFKRNDEELEPEPVPFKPTASPAEVAARALADLKAQREAPVATVTELRYTSESKR